MQVSFWDDTSLLEHNHVLIGMGWHLRRSYNILVKRFQPGTQTILPVYGNND